MKKIVRSLLLVLGIACSSQFISAAGNEADSLAFVNAPWQVSVVPDDFAFVRTQTDLFDSRQAISFVAFPADSFCITLYPHEGLELVSATAQAHDGLAAINAGYWNMSTDIPATYIRSKGVDVSQTEDCEAYRVNGVVIFKGDDVDIEYCDTAGYPALAEKYDNILSCGPLLIDNGKAFDYSGGNSFFTNRHPRSVIGKTADGDIIFLVVDGRIKGEAAGVSIPELTQICQWMGMTDALNLDGGGSSTLWFMGNVVNHPSDNKTYDNQGERKVSSSIVVSKK